MSDQGILTKMRKQALIMARRMTARWGPVGLIACVLACGVAGAAVAQHRPDGSAGAHIERAVAAKGLRAPTPRSPANGTQAQSMPPFGWSAVRGAAKYEFQLSADRRFASTLRSAQTLNTFASVDKMLTDGTYYWRVRSIGSKDVAGPWSPVRSFTKAWTTAPALLSPASGASITYPAMPLVLHWSSVPHAFKYRVYIGTDPSLASIAPGLGGKSVETSGTSFALPQTLPSGTYYWGVRPEDAEAHTGTLSNVSSFTWTWPTATVTSIADSSGPAGTDAQGHPEVLSPQLSWNRIPGAAAYEVEINPAQDFTPGSKVCCSGFFTPTSVSPTQFLSNNVYHWRVRAFDLAGNAGQWNGGPDFRKAFDDVTPSIPNLQVADGNDGLLRWDPVPGASSYEVDIAPFTSNDCQWLSGPTFKTATTAWSPLASSGGSPGPLSWPGTSSDLSSALISGQSYCARVIARSDRDLKGKEVVSVYTQLGDTGAPAFTYNPSSAPGVLTDAQDSDYLPPLDTASGTVTPHMPVFRWKPITGADKYLVVVAKDQSFTNVVDVAATIAPVYAPRTRTTPRTYSDENTSYYWQVLPVSGSTCLCDWATGDEHPQAFDKRSNSPALLAPGPGQTLDQQPVFHWSRAEGARSYRIQVSQDPTFHALVDDIVTDSSSFTSSTTYPADTNLYWRVRANDENNIGLNWSAVSTFRRVIPVPSLSANNPVLSADVPVVTWDPLPGATSYTLRLEQGDGTTKSFDDGSAAFTPTGFVGVGNVRWQVRANFPKLPNGELAGPYSPLQSFTREIAPPTGVHWTQGKGHILLSWDPSTNIGTKQYKVQISSTNSFSRTIETHTTENTNYAPTLASFGYKDGGTLYWRVASMDERRTVGAWTTRTLTLPGRMRIQIKGTLRSHHPAKVKVTLLNRLGRAIRGGKVRVTGVGFRTVARRTGKHGTVTFRIRPKRTGKLKFQGSKSGYQSASATLRVR
jgi:hypothetical protein